MFRRFANWLIDLVSKRPPDFVIGGYDNPYLLRWYLTPWSRYDRRVPPSQKTLWQRFKARMPGIYLHHILKSDDDRALHDHPWFNCSIILTGCYVERSILAGGIKEVKFRSPGSVAFRFAKKAHRLEILNASPDTSVADSCWTLFIHGFRTREWGFHCPDRGWVHWRDFTASNDAGAIGKGCE